MLAHTSGLGLPHRQALAAPLAHQVGQLHEAEQDANGTAVVTMKRVKMFSEGLEMKQSTTLGHGAAWHVTTRGRVYRG